MNRRQRRRQASLQGPPEQTPKTQALFEKAVARYQSGQQGNCLLFLEQLLALAPNHPGALCLMGTITVARGDADRGIELLEKAVSLAPKVASFHNNLGVALGSLGDYAKAAKALEKAALFDVKNTDYSSNLSGVYRNLGQLEKADQTAKAALAIDPDHLGALTNLASIRDDRGELDEASSLYRRVLNLDPDNLAALNNLAQILRRLGQLTEAESLLEKATRQEAATAEVWSTLADCLRDRGDIGPAMQAYDRALQLPGAKASMHSNGLHALLMAATDGAAILAAHHDYQQKWALAEQPIPVKPRQKGNPGRFRIGYISGDLRRHSVAYFLEPLLAHHNQSRFEVFCYRTHGADDAVTERLRQKVDHWRDLDGLGPDGVRGVVLADQLQVLIDLSGHTAGNRLVALSSRLAPVQLSWLGYPATTGLAAMDGRIVDDWTDPKGMSDHFHSEDLIRLDGGFNLYQAPEKAPDPIAGPGGSGGAVTFGSFNALSKIGSSVLDVWANILRDNIGSRLLLKSRFFDDEGVSQRLRAAFENRGISADRVRLVGWLAGVDHLALYNQIDIALDPFPFNGATTSCEALWMGRPVISLLGPHHAGRVGYSLLARLGRQDWVASSLDDYIAIAGRLGSDPDGLKNHHLSLRQIMLDSPLMNGPAFAQNFEQALIDFYDQRALGSAE